MAFIDGGFHAIIQKNHLEMRHYDASIFAHCQDFSQLHRESRAVTKAGAGRKMAHKDVIMIRM